MADSKTITHAASKMALDTLIACHECDALHRKIPLDDYALARCARCGAVLYRHITGRIDTLLALTLASAIIFMIANSFPIVELQTSGMTRQATLFGGIWQLWQEKMYFVAAMIFCSTALCPAIELVALIYVLTALTLGRHVPGLKPLIHLIQAVQPWGMIEVFVLGTLIALVKLSSTADLTLGPALFAFIALSVLLALLSLFKPRDLWHSIESHFSNDLFKC